ncbi:MAG TPA: glycine cleavage T C-terminal barrel domain-containing protein [Acidimicrobiia bacterium]|nr:glycine cleavage T C-terminal barrel domain-containing protein [Acidimicrobiia bacterium]
MRPASYGDVVAEHRAIRQDVASVSGGHDLVWVDGPGAAGFLQGILSQDVEQMQPGEVRRSFLLAPQGKLEALLWLLRDPERVGVVVDAGLGAHVAERLNYYRIRVKAEVRTDDRPVRVLWGPRAREVTDTGDRWSEREGVVTAPIPTRDVDRVLVAGDLDVGDVTPAGELAMTAARVESGEPVMGRDVDESTIPQESGLVPEAVSFTKGCYLGQELVARIDSRGRVNRHLRGVAVTRNVIPPEGAVVWAGDREAGPITSVTESVFVGAPIALGLLRHEAAPGDEVEIRWEGGSVPAVVRELPFLGP